MRFLYEYPQGLDCVDNKTTHKTVLMNILGQGLTRVDNKTTNKTVTYL